MSKKKKKHDKSLRRKLRKMRKTADRGPARERKWEEDYRAGKGEDISAPFERIVSRRDRRQSEIDTARELLREEEVTGAELPAEAVEGVVVELIPGGCIVQHDGEQTRCLLRGMLKSLETKERNVLAVGDYVYYTPLEEGAGVIESIGPRKTVLSRKYMEREHVVAVNVDQLVIVASVEAPPIRTGLIDRYLVAAHNGGLEPVIFLNKADLATDDEPFETLKIYEDLGYRLIACSAEEQTGLDQVREALTDKSSIFAGQSGVGKSSILNALQPGLELRVGEVSETTRKGTHTTTSVRLLKLDFGGWVVDTPGIREFGLWDINPEDVQFFFPEFQDYIGKCKLRGCTHTHEPGCAVKQAVEDGEISAGRYESYERLVASQQE